MKKIILTLMSLCMALLANSQTNTFPTTGNAGIGVTNPTTSLLEMKNINMNYLQGLNIQLTGVPGFVVDQTYGVYVVNNMGGSQNGPSRYGGYFEARGYSSSSNFNYGLVGVGNKFGGYGYSTIGVLGIGRHTYSVYGTNNTSLIGVKGLVEFVDDGNTLTNTTYGASLYGEAIVPSNKTLTTYYGLYLKTPTGNITNKWGVYQSDAGSKNFMAGKMGIGTSTPSEKLEIFNSVTTPGVISLMSSRNDASYVDVGRISAKQLAVEVARIGLPRAGGTNTGFLTFWTKADNSVSLTEKMRLDEDGNLGIGTTSPTEKLSVNGNLLAKKVRVSINAADWPDYVFASNYQLRSLSEVEDFIKENRHLPEVPSAKEVETNGLDLGDMDATLLKKMEELTLYMIELNKTVKKQEERIKTLEKENQTLKEKIN